MRIGTPQTPATPLPQLQNLKGLDGSENFGQMLKDALGEVNGLQSDSRQLQNDYLQGKPVEFHDLMIKMEQASTAMSLTLQVRNKLLEAYQEVSRTQV
jgi:flagellar hook-basal body complex protein FliE